MKNCFLLIVLSLVTISSNGQNLIANPSFEHVNYCETNIPCSPSAWYSVSDIPFGYDNDLFTSIDGKHSLAFLIASGEGIRSYWQTKLLCNLEKGREYSISFDVRPFNGDFNPAYFGITFLENILRSKNDTLIQMERNHYLTPSKVSTLKNGWFRTSLVFTASGDEGILLMGNMNLLSNAEILQTAPHRQNFIGYYIDNLSLEPTDKTVKICEESTLRRDSLFAENSRHMNIVRTPKTFSSDKPDNSLPPSKKDTIVLGTINFNFDSDVLLNSSILNYYFNSIDQNELLSIHIIGYTDSIGSNTYNLKLSERRAISVKKYLTENLKLQPQLIKITGKGVSRDQEQLELNRRVEIIISRKSENITQ